MSAASTTRLPTNLILEGDLTVNGALPSYPRSSLAQDDFTVHQLPLERFRVWDAVATTLPGTSATDDLGLITGTFGTAPSYIGTGDVKNTTTITRYARIGYCLPPEYVAGQSVRMNLHAGMITTVSSGVATVDVECYKIAQDGTTGVGSDLCTTAATTIKSLTFSDKPFDITATALAPGDWLDIRITVNIVDSATATAVIGAILTAEMHLDIKG
jgi:hypothetical protein